MSHRAWPSPRRWALLVCALCLACARGQVPAQSFHASTQVDVIAVGHGDSILVTSGQGKHLLIDGGEAEAAKTILEHLRQQHACPLDLILLTHRHSDHLGGLPRIIDACGAKLFLDGGGSHDTATYLHLLRTLEKLAVPLRQAEAGRQIDLGAGSILTLLGPPSPFIDVGSESVNSNSVVARLSQGKTSMLFTGDADIHEETWLMEQGFDLRSDVLKVGHHGSRTSSGTRFLRTVRPGLAVVSTCTDDPKHPHPETLARLREVHATVVETDREGTLRIELDGETVTWRSDQHPQATRLP